MIQSFADEITEQLANGCFVRKLPVEIQRQALKRLNFLKLAQRLDDLYIPPSNHFHALSGKGRYAIRVNRACPKFPDF
ncbi:MAG: type II toxin-antitoxin system RelE/ParE family toxin [Opitutus sp.]|nr:type II toxin-antitoxin system RelE/ParE family toxin [Opitutus sp.]MCS6277761.1 type II toxin-antitoxin system RelE/ParE family toxin [Opitutus sp.]